MDNLSRAQNKENEIKIENLKGTFSGFEKHSLDTEKELKATIEQFTDLINYHINNKSNPHNVTSEQVTIISDPSPYQDASYSGDNYPMGISTFHLSSGSVGYPSSYGECLNVKTTKYRFAQFFFHAGNRDDPRIYLRHWYPSSGWTEFITVPSSSDLDSALAAAKAYTDDHANNKENPHSVTKAQVGLGNVDNIQQAAKSDFDKHDSDNTRHITSDERKKWSAAQLFKITADSGMQKINLTSGTFYDALKDVGTVSFFGTNAVTDSPSKSSLRGMQLVGQAGIGMGYAADASGSAWWFYYNGNQTAINWIPIESTTGAQARVDVHAKNTTIHVTQSEKDKWNAGQLSKITNDAGGVFVSIGDTDDFYTKIVQSGKRFGTFYSTGKPTNAPSSLSTRGFFHFTVEDSDGKGTYGYVVAIDYRNNMYTNYLDPTLGWQGWSRVLSDTDLSPSWNNVTLINGVKQDANYPLKFSISNNILWLRGTFGTLPAIGTSVAKFTNKPTQLIDFVVPTIGSYGTARFAFTTDGDLRFDGMMANDNASVSRVSFNIGVPLW
ncbi:DNA-packaging protein [Bacillus glycinifermentans]|uniref:DNA-packaging protein n=1 Tax=Bacillus glycinifermentans TaxID=1664069 RepID=UPI001583F6DF|nr:DNA-packaging protein [Bacillus glycinifermentans]NUJ16869.1 DNA-packaging protein [Bacillus glycinifermentans]